MARRAPERAAEPTGKTPAESEHAACLSVRALVLTRGRGAGAALKRCLAGFGATCDTTRTIAGARVHVYSHDVLLIEAGEGWEEALALASSLRDDELAPCAALVVERAEQGLTLAALRAGAADVLELSAPLPELRARLLALSTRTRTRRARALRRQRQVARLKQACRRLGDMRDELLNQLGRVCTDLAGACREVGEHLPDVHQAGELESLLRQELDVESLLRTTLEWLLKRVGSTNAAIFLPGTTGDFTLGAYVNYDCPRENAESMLEHLCDVVAPSFEQAGGLHVVERPGELSPSLDGAIGWMADTTMAVYACVEENECIGVLTVFRDRRNPFDEKAQRSLETLGGLFGRQLARVIKTHHRHKPKDAWGVPEEDAGEGMAG